jgi:hypothetical protein
LLWKSKEDLNKVTGFFLTKTCPFEYDINQLPAETHQKKSRVSSKANMIAKTLLHLSALSAVKSKEDHQDYYHRKIKEGKDKMSILNAIRNKFIHRMFACVKQDQLFEKKSTCKKSCLDHRERNKIGSVNKRLKCFMP